MPLGQYGARPNAEVWAREKDGPENQMISLDFAIAWARSTCLPLVTPGSRAGVSQGLVRSQVTGPGSILPLQLLLVQQILSGRREPAGSGWQEHGEASESPPRSPCSASCRRTFCETTAQPISPGALRFAKPACTFGILAFASQ